MPSAPCDLGSSRPGATKPGQRRAPRAGVPSAGAAPADALFASALQRSDHPTFDQVRQAIAAAAAAYGSFGCAARVAQAFGEHPETAVPRMRWARTLAARALPVTCLAA
jgi:hypothetical protein